MRLPTAFEGSNGGDRFSRCWDSFSKAIAGNCLEYTATTAGNWKTYASALPWKACPRMFQLYIFHRSNITLFQGLL